MVRRSFFCMAGPTTSHSFVDVAPLLASAGYRVIVPYLRGYGATRFLSSDTVRNGQPSALALDIDRLYGCSQDRQGDSRRLRLGRAIRRTSSRRCGRSACKATVSVSGYLIGSQEAGKTPLPPKAEFEWWYQFYFATERGRLGYDKYRREFSRLIWETRFTEMAVRRCHIRSQRGSLRQPRSRRDRDP